MSVRIVLFKVGRQTIMPGANVCFSKLGFLKAATRPDQLVIGVAKSALRSGTMVEYYPATGSLQDPNAYTSQKKQRYKL